MYVGLVFTMQFNYCRDIISVCGNIHSNFNMSFKKREKINQNHKVKVRNHSFIGQNI